MKIDVLRLVKKAFTKAKQPSMDVLHSEAWSAIQKGKNATVLASIFNRNPFVLEYCSASCWNEVHEMHTLLHRIFRDQSRPLPTVDVIELLIRRGPAAVRTKAGSCNMYLPIFYACCRQDITVEILELLVESYPACLKTEEPLTYACLHGLPFDVIEYLLERSPGGIIKHNAETTLLHQECKKTRPRPDIIKLLVSSRPEAMKFQDKRGCTPLYYLCCCKEVPDDLIKFVFELCPEAATLPTCDGNTPLHSAILLNKIAVVHFITERIPSLCIFPIHTCPTVLNLKGGQESDDKIFPVVEERLQKVSMLLVGDLVRSRQQLPTQMFDDIAQRLAEIHSMCPYPTFQELETILSNDKEDKTEEDHNRYSEKSSFSLKDVHDDLQALLGNEVFGSVLECYRAMFDAGSFSYLREDPGNISRGVFVCSLLAEHSLGALFSFVRKSPLLFTGNNGGHH